MEHLTIVINGTADNQLGKIQRTGLAEAVKELRAEQGKFARTRANTPGTAEYVNRQRQREAAKIDEAIWNSAHDPETFNSDDW
jgi:hypothetical protein